MGALLDELAAIEGEDTVGVAERGEPVGDRDRRPPADQNGERLLDALLRLGVDVARRLVEHEHPRIVEQRPRDREPLLLAAGQTGPVLAQEGLVGQRLAAEKVVGAGRLRGCKALFDRRLRPAVGEVLPDRSPKEKRFLEDDAEFLTQVVHRQVAEIDAIDRDAPLLHVVKPRQQADERGLAGAAPPHDPHHLSRPHLERHVAEDRLIAIVAECHVVEANCTADILPGHRVLRLSDQGWCVEQFQHPLAAGEKARQPGREVRQRAQGGVEHREVGEESDQLAERHLAADHVPPADIPDDQPAEPEDDLHRGGVGGVGVFDPLPPLAEMVAGGMEAVTFP